MKGFISLWTFFLVSSALYGQYINTIYKDVQEIKKRILLVGLPEDNKDIIAQLEQDNPAYVALYKNDMEGQRLALKEAVLQHWKFTDSIAIMMHKEAKALVRKNPDNYALLKFEQFQDRIYATDKVSEPPVTAWEKVSDKIIYNSLKRYNVRILGITSLSIETPKKTFESYLPKMSPSRGDFIFAIKQMEYVLSEILKDEASSAHKIYRQVSLQTDQLKNKVLLLDGRELGCKEEEIKKSYPYPFKIVSYEEIEKVLISADTNYAVIQTSRYDPNNSVHYVSNVGNGTIYNFVTGLTFTYGEQQGTFFRVQVFYPSISIKHIEQYGSKR